MGTVVKLFLFSKWFYWSNDFLDQVHHKPYLGGANMAKFLGRDRKCFHVGESSRGLREPCVVVDEEVREIKDTQRYLVKKERGEVEEVSGVTLVPQR